MHFKHFKKLMKQHSSDVVASAVSKTISEISPGNIHNFDFNSHKSGLLLGHVQSGKTGHMLGILADAADHDFEMFIILTTDSTHLQKQTLERALCLLDTFCVCDEQEDIRFQSNNMRKPVVLVLKKNARVLKTWKNRLISSKFLNGRAVFIIDDEGDAASLNTKANKKEISTINQRISNIRELSNSSFYLQVTATPQAILLQHGSSGFRPEFVHYFEPGVGYLGGDFFYSTAEPIDNNQFPYPIIFTAEEELIDLREDGSSLPEGMQQAFASFLVASADIHINKTLSSCNFLIHPSVSISDHKSIEESIIKRLKFLFSSMRDDNSFEQTLQVAWLNLKTSKPDIVGYQECLHFIFNLIENEQVTISVMNSKSKFSADFTKGTNIVIGGNSLGRGVTFPNLQTTYYCRKSKKPQADTFWQHSRAFGYDRDPSLVRIFIPPTVFQLYAYLNNSNKAMIECIVNDGLEGLQLIYPKGVSPTRPNVVDKDQVEIITGGVNQFPSYPTIKNTDKIDTLLDTFSEKTNFHFIEIELLKKIINLCESEYATDWPKDLYINCLDSIKDKNHKSILIIRRDRNIGRNTGTLLSPDDRKLGDTFTNDTVLTMYKITGEKWGCPPFWIPNIKLPHKQFFYGVKNN